MAEAPVLPQVPRAKRRFSEPDSPFSGLGLYGSQELPWGHVDVSCCAVSLAPEGLACHSLDGPDLLRTWAWLADLVRLTFKERRSPGSGDYGGTNRGPRASSSRRGSWRMCEHTHTFTLSVLPPAEPLGKGQLLRAPSPQVMTSVTRCQYQVAIFPLSVYLQLP